MIYLVKNATVAWVSNFEICYSIARSLYTLTYVIVSVYIYFKFSKVHICMCMHTPLRI